MMPKVAKLIWQVKTRFWQLLSRRVCKLFIDLRLTAEAESIGLVLLANQVILYLCSMYAIHMPSVLFCVSKLPHTHTHTHTL